MVAEEASLDGSSSTPGSLTGSDALIPAELVAELAKTAKLHRWKMVTRHRGR